MSDYKITVVVATYNSGDYIREFLDSIKSQSIGFANIEVIFVDDNSSDEYTLDLLKDIDNSYTNVNSIFLKDNSGFPGTGRNTGLKNSNADYIIFADHDDSYTENAFEVMLDRINGNDILISNFNQVYPDRTVPFKSVYENEVNIASIDEDINLLKLPAAIWTRLFKKSFLIENDILFLEGMLAEDVYVASKSMLLGDGIIYLNDFYSYNYKIRDTENDKSTIHVRNKKYIEAILNGYYKIDEMLGNLNKTSYGKTIFEKHLTSWLYTIVLSQIPDSDKKELFEKSFEIFQKYYTPDPYFKKRYNKLVKYILNKEFDKAVSQSNKLKLKQKNMNDKSLISKLIGKVVR